MDKDFTQISTLKTLYLTLVRPILEYGILIWFLYQQYQIDKLNSICDKFVKYVACILSTRDPTTDFNELSKRLNLWKL